MAVTSDLRGLLRNKNASMVVSWRESGSGGSRGERASVRMFTVADLTVATTATFGENPIDSVGGGLNTAVAQGQQFLGVVGADTVQQQVRTLEQTVKYWKTSTLSPVQVSGQLVTLSGGDDILGDFRALQRLTLPERNASVAGSSFGLQAPGGYKVKVGGGQVKFRFGSQIVFQGMVLTAVSGTISRFTTVDGKPLQIILSLSLDYPSLATTDNPVGLFRRGAR